MCLLAVWWLSTAVYPSKTFNRRRQVIWGNTFNQTPFPCNALCSCLIFLICDCWIITLNWKKKDCSSFLLLLWKRSFIPSIEILPLSHSPHTYYLFRVSFSNNGNKPLKANAVLTVTSLFSASPSSAGSSQQLLEPNKGNPLMAVIVCGWQVPEWQPASRACMVYWPEGQEKEEDSWEKIPWHPLLFQSMTLLMG